MAPQIRRLPFGNPLANALVAVVGVLVVGASVVLGFLAFVTLGTLLLVLASVIGIRVWWFNRKLKARMGSRPAAHKPGSGSRSPVIEGEYQIVSPAKRPDSNQES